MQDLELIDRAEEWSGEIAAQIREIDYIKSVATAKQRAELIQQTISSGLQEVSPAERSKYLKKLKRRFPTFNGNLVEESVRSKPAGKYLEAKLEPVLQWLVNELKTKNTEDRQAVWDRFVEAGVVENMISSTLPNTLNYLLSVKSRLDAPAMERVRKVLAEFGLPEEITKDQTSAILKWVGGYFSRLSPDQRTVFWTYFEHLGVVPPAIQQPGGGAIGMDLKEVRRAFGLPEKDSMDSARLDKLLAEMVLFTTQMFGAIWTLHRKLSKAPGAGKTPDLKGSVRAYLTNASGKGDAVRDLDATKKACALAIELFGDMGGKFWVQAIQKLDPTVIEDSVKVGFMAAGDYYWKEYKRRFKFIETRDRFQAEYELLFGEELNESLKAEGVKIPQNT